MARQRKYATIEEFKAAQQALPSRKRAQKRLRERQRAAVLAILGNVCAYCGFDDKRALQIDHINGGGNKHRTLISNVSKYYKTVIESVMSDEQMFQLLCANCNVIKRIVNSEHKVT